MRNFTYSWILLLGSILVSCSAPSDLQNLTGFVDPFIGTAGHGHTFPGATLPFAMVQLSPDNNHEGWDWCSGYHSSWDTIAGFSHTHLSGTGVGDLMDIALLPTIKELSSEGSSPESGFMNNFYAPFSHENETAKPGYYAVTLDDGIKAELTTTLRSGFHRYTFPESAEASVIIDLS